MNNLKKVGLTALGTALVASSAQAADFSISATSQITLAGADNGNKGNGFSMSDSISFAASGEMDNGFTITHDVELDNTQIGFLALSVDTGDMGKLTFIGGSSTSVMGVWDDLTPSANEESWGVGYAGTPDTPANGSAITHNIMTYDYTIMDGLALKASYVPSHTTGAVEGSVDYGVKYTGVEGLTVYAAMGENNDAANSADVSMAAAIYTAGALSVGYQVNESDFGTGTSDEDFTALGISYAVSDDLSVSLNTSTIDYEASTKDDQEATSVSFSHTSGGMTISGSYGNMDNVAGTPTADNSAYEINFKFAF
jgi:outer membrane protein OmpU